MFLDFSNFINVINCKPSYIYVLKKVQMYNTTYYDLKALLPSCTATYSGLQQWDGITLWATVICYFSFELKKTKKLLQICISTT